MKKLIMAAAIVCAAAFAQAATVGWTFAGMTGNAGDAYSLFVIGQNGVTDVAQITSLLAAGTDVSSYAFGSGNVAANGSAMKAATAAGAPSLAAGSYTSFFVLFDEATPTAGSTKFAVIDGLAKESITIGASAATASFAAGSIAAQVNAANWQSFGSAGPIAPEPTSGLLILLGMAGLALKRKVA